MISKHKKSHRIIATLFLLIFFPTLVPNNMFASNNGPKSPEAASFEPVDATDMVNLITGQYSYVLPLLNVPSPEGGYPIALGYHAGIALDQEASWAGLGWNVNPGAIDRGVNGYPDDYNASKLNEYFWDRTHTDTRYTASLGYSIGVASVGVGFNWGSNQALGGSVSVGLGIDLGAGNSAGINATVGSEGASIGLGVQFSGGLTIGVSANTNGNVEANAGFNSNGSGFSVSTSGSLSIQSEGGGSIGISKDGSFSISALGVSLSTSENHVSVQVGGVGISTSFNNTMSVGDYATSSSGWMIPIVVPTPIGIFSASFGKQEFKYWMGKNVNDYVTGTMNFNKGVNDVIRRKFVSYHHGEVQRWITETIGKSFMDINELSINSVDGTLSTETDVVANNMTFPNYDNFGVSGQGISGSMSATHYKNGALFGLDGKENKEGYTLKYTVRNQNASGTDFTKFNSKPQFDFDNEITSYLGVESAQFNINTTNTLALNYYSSGIDVNGKARRRTSSYIEYFTNEEITTATSYDVLKANGFLQASASGFDRTTMPKDGVGAFKVTTVDGKTYHYSLPVYNHEIITRTNGVIPDSPNEWESYFEKRQLEPFATHWLLTAVTGPDFVDNGDGIAGDGDLGYWTSFEYGKWTDAFIWKNPYKKDKLIDEKDPRIQTWIRGRKQLYYLDKIKTRTHTALFIKSERKDAPSPEFQYWSAEHINNKQDNFLSHRFTVPAQNQLRLEKIILLKNTDNKVDKTYGADTSQNIHIHYNQSAEKEDLEAKYNMYDNVLDTGDNLTSCIAKAVKVIDFNYDYSLVTGDNRLTLKSIYFKGKEGTTVLPPYRFDYINDYNAFNIDNKDGWGYLADKPEAFSLNKITTPQGGTINIGYESNKLKSITKHDLEFSSYNAVKFNCSFPNITPSSPTDLTSKKVIISIGGIQNYPITLGQNVSVNYYRKYLSDQYSSPPGPLGQLNPIEGQYVYDIFESSYVGTGIITALPNTMGIGKYEVTFNNNPNTVLLENILNDYIIEYGYDRFMADSGIISKVAVNIDLNNNTSIYTGGGPRVKYLKISDATNNYVTDYKYGQNEDGIGYVSYLPYSQNVVKEVPYSAELPAPRVMYEYVTTSSHKDFVEPLAKMRYRFNIMKEKSPDKIKYGAFYEIVKTSNPSFTNTANNKEVSINSYTVKENFAALGQLLEVSTLNSKNQLLSNVYSTYYNINEIPNNMGVTQESYQSYKEVDYTDPNAKDKWIINSSTRIKYPSIIKSSTEQKNGYTYTTQFNDYDLISGVSMEQVHTSSNGQYYKTKSIPAYLKYANMGSKVDNINNKNMLSQTTADYSYILDKASNTWKETGVGITTWSNIWSYKDIAGTTVAVPTTATAKQKIWRKHKSFVWNGVKDTQGIFTNYNGATDDGFDWTVGIGSQPAQWKQASEITLYDHYSAPLEMKDINGNLASTKMGDNETKVMATGNAGYNEMYFAGAENIIAKYPTPPPGSPSPSGTDLYYWLEPEISMSSPSQLNSTNFHTGKNSVATTNTAQFGTYMQMGQHRAGKYKVSVWVEKTNAAKAILIANNVNINFQPDAIIAGNWQLKTAYVNVPAGNCEIYLKSVDAATVYYDDLMIRPLASSVTGYVYNEWDELTYIIGNNGLATQFEYDKAGRLIKTYVEVVDDTANGVVGGFKLKAENKINYKNLYK
jgi:hypothetical protein